MSGKKLAQMILMVVILMIWISTKFARTPIDLLAFAQRSSTEKHDGDKARYRIGKTTVEGTQVLTAEQVIHISGLNPNRLGTTESTARAEKLVKQALVEKGFILSEVSISRSSSGSPHRGRFDVVDLTIRIREGPMFVIGRLDFSGNRATKDSLIFRAVGLRPGEPYSPARVDRAIRRLNRLGRFARVKRKDVAVEINDQNHLVFVSFHFTERKPNKPAD